MPITPSLERPEQAAALGYKLKLLCQKPKREASKKTQQAKAPAAVPYDLSSISRTHMEEGETRPSDLHLPVVAHTPHPHLKIKQSH